MIVRGIFISLRMIPMKPSLRSNPKKHLSCNMFWWFAVYSVLDYFLGQHVVLNNLVEQPGLGSTLIFCPSFEQPKATLLPTVRQSNGQTIHLNGLKSCLPLEQNKSSHPKKREEHVQKFGGFLVKLFSSKTINNFGGFCLKLFPTPKKSSRCYRTYNLIHYQQ